MWLVFLVAFTHALQFVMNTSDPFCIEVTPKSYTEGMTVSYTVTGMNED